MALSDIYQIKHRCVFIGEPALNVYHVERSDPAFKAADITLAFQESIMQPLADCQSVTYFYEEVFAENLDDPTDFDTRIQLGQAGTHTGQNAPTSLAFSIRFPRQRTDMRDGFKRWGGMTETMYTAQNTESAFQGLMSLLGTALIGDWEHAAFPGITVCNYVILKRICNAFDAEGKCTSYRLPETGDPLIFYQPQSFVFKVPVRTQVSRRAPA